MSQPLCEEETTMTTEYGLPRLKSVIDYLLDLERIREAELRHFQAGALPPLQETCKMTKEKFDKTIDSMAITVVQWPESNMPISQHFKMFDLPPRAPNCVCTWVDEPSRQAALSRVLGLIRSTSVRLRESITIRSLIKRRFPTLTLYDVQYKIIGDFFHQVQPAINFTCSKCGKECSVAPELPARAVCEKCCGDHDYQYERGECGWFCVHCFKEAPYDWHDHD